MAAVTSVINQTPARLTLVNIDGEKLVLAPLQEKAISENSGFYFEDLERTGFVRTRTDAPSSLREKLSVALLGGGFWVVIAALVLANMDPMLGFDAALWPYVVWGVLFFLLTVAVAWLIIGGTNSWSLVVRWTMNTVALTVILAIGVGLPGATIYYFGDGRELLDAALDGPGPSLPLFGRLLQLALIATASLLPVLLFFLFDRYQLATLRKRLDISLFRLDPSLKTISEIDAKYGSQIGELYGSDTEGRGRVSPGTRWPVLVCAFVVTLGWIVALAPVGAFAPQNGSDLIAALAPQRSVAVFGFLGVYFFSLRLIARRYARGDLRPKAYTSIMVRLFVVLVLSWVLGAVFAGEPTMVLALAFLFGITPDEFFTWLKQITRGVAPEGAFPQSPLPLNELEGIDIYDLGRLESEGIVNIEALAHHELIDLIIETRIPVARLIDWVDQAILYLHVAGGSDEKAREKLRDYGIRTATDLLVAWTRASERGEAELAAFKKLLGGEGPPFRLEIIRDALLDDEWLTTVQFWRDEQERKDSELKALPSTVANLEQLADKEQEAQRYNRALQLLKESLGVQDTAKARRRIARILASSPVTELRNSAEARAHALRAFELAPMDYAGTKDLCDIYILLGDEANAARMHAEATKLLATLSDDKQRAEGRARLTELKSRLDALTPLLRGTPVPALGT